MNRSVSIIHWKKFLSTFGVTLTIISIAVTLLALFIENSSKKSHQFSGDNSGTVNMAGGSITFNNDPSKTKIVLEREDMLRYTISTLEQKLNEATKNDATLARLVQELSQAREELDKLLEEKAHLENINYEYRVKYAELSRLSVGPTANTATDPRYSDEKYSDIRLIDRSKVDADNVLNEISETHDELRLDKILHLLISETESMKSDSEKQYWRDIMPAMSFDQKFQLLNILSTERVKLAALNEKYKLEIMDLNTKHMHRLKESQFREKFADVKKRGDKLEIALYKLKESTILEKDTPISTLRDTEKKIVEFIKENPNYLEGYIYYSEILNFYRENRSYDLIMLFSKKEDIFGNDPKYNEIIGRAYSRVNKEKEAYQYIKKAALKISDDPSLHSIFARLAINNSEDFGFVLKILEENIEKKYKDIEFIYYYCKILEINKEYDKIINMITQYCNTQGNDPALLNLLAWVYFYQQKYNLSAKTFILSITDGSVSIYGKYIQAGIATIEYNNDYNEALDLFLKGYNILINDYPEKKEDIGEAALAIALIYSEAKQYDKIIDYASVGAEHTFGCNQYRMQELNWHNNMISLLQKHRRTIGCP
jgi:hypothetical protein